ncbi:MAG: hypothetical protein JWQ96_475 [Segetibacter sp.]|nr:hypothetical protein [Segetibacter sp.]
MFKQFRILFFIACLLIGLTSTCFCQVSDSLAPIPVLLSDTSTALIVIGDIDIKGYKKTKVYIIEREIPFKQGEYMLRSDLAKKLILCRQQLINTSLYVDVEVKVDTIKNEIAFISVTVKERWYLFPVPYFKIVDRNFNVWWVENKRSLSRVNYGLKFMQNNVSGRNDNLSIWLVTGYTREASLRYENPFLDKSLKHGMNIGISFNQNHEVVYATDSNKLKFLNDPNNFLIKRYNFDAAYTYRPAIKTRHIFRVSYSDITVADTVVEKNPQFFPQDKSRMRLPEIGYTIQYFNVDYNPYPLKGFSGEASFSQRFGKKANITQVGGRGTFTTSVIPKTKTYLQLQAAALFRVPFNQPYSSRGIFGGNDMYMRGLEYYVIDGSYGLLGRATAIQQLLNTTLRNPIGTKTHDKIPLRVYLKAYSDLGYARSPYTLDNSMLNNKLLRTYGAGIDVVTFYDLVMKIEYSFNQLGQGGFFFHTKSDF